MIFDCDGVLVDSEPLACASFSRAIKAEGLDWSIEETMRRAFARRVGVAPAEYRARFRRAPEPVG